MTLAIISHEACLLHEMGEGHPEQPARIQVLAEALKGPEFNGACKNYVAPLATREQLLRVHTPHYLDQLQQLSPQQGWVQVDPDTAMNPYTLQAAFRAAGAAVYGVDLVMAGEVEKAFCNVRPPGHHAERACAMGFCFFNNIAVAIMQALEVHHLERVAIIDFDVHHGNGTEAIFEQEERVLLCSSFQHPFYPYSGAETRNGHILNLPLPEGTSGKVWREAIAARWFDKLHAFEPQFLFFSAGFDGYQEDVMANFKLVEEDYFWLTEQILKMTEASTQGRVLSVLEGGYHLGGLSRCAAAHLRAML